MFCPPSPHEALGFSYEKSLQSFREGKLISLTEIIGSHYKLKKLLKVQSFVACSNSPMAING
jgi:hypothetical protein